MTILLTVAGQTRPVPRNNPDSASLRPDSLKAVVVTANIRPHLAGDTIRYNTSNLGVPPNAMVEEMLKRLPGLHIGPDGSITYNGERIQQVLVDGEDVFGSDPTLVTRNFDAVKIARVEIVERKTNESLFTGIDDGARTKVLNLVMKESEKNGYFGKVDAGGDPGRYYDADGLLAGFRSRLQMASLGMTANTGVLNSEGSDEAGSGLIFLNGAVDPLGASAGAGIPRFNAGALHYANTYSNMGDHLLANYQYSHFHTQPVTTTQTLSQEPDSVYLQFQKSNSENQQDQHWAYAVYDWALNSTAALKITLHGSNSAGYNQYQATANDAFNDTMVNTSVRTINDKSTNTNFGGELAWRMQIGGNSNRVFSVVAGASRVNNTTDGYIYDLENFYLPTGGLQSVDTVDQRKTISDLNLNMGAYLNYSQPIWKKGILGLSYGAAYIKDDPYQGTFNRGDGKYQDRVDSLSSYFNTYTLVHRAMVNIQGSAGHLAYTAGTDWIGNYYHQKDLIADSALKVNYFNWTPRLLLSYSPNSTIGANLRYNGIETQPTPAQLTPVINNNDPLHITVGNPRLKAAIAHNLALDFHRFKTWQFDLSLNLSLLETGITPMTTTDSLGRQLSEPVNVKGGSVMGINVSAGRKLLGFDFSLHGMGSSGQTFNYVNSSLSRNDVKAAGGGLSMVRFLANRYSIELNTSISYFDESSSINSSAPVHYWSQNHSGAVTVYWHGFELNTGGTYTWQEKTNAFSSNTSVLLWNAYVSRNFLHNKLVVKFQYNNILNANAGITRTNTGNINTQSSTNILGRYWMLSGIYHFDKKFKRK